MYRFMVGFLHVLAPVQVGIAVTLTHADWNRRQGVEIALAVATALMIWTAWWFHQLAESQVRTRARLWFKLFYLLPLIAIGICRVTYGQAVEAEWRSFQIVYLSRAERPPTRVGPWAITEVLAAPNVPQGEVQQTLRKLVLALVRVWATDFLRIQTSTPSWAYVCCLLVAVCYRTKPKQENT